MKKQNQHRNITQIDSETGEEIGSAMVVIAQRTPTAFQKGRFFMTNQNAMEAIATSNLSGEDLRVFMLLCAHLDFENYIGVAQSKIADKLKMKRPHVSRAIKHLLESDVLVKGPKVGRTLTYRLNPNVGWKGRGSNHRNAIEKAQENWSKAQVI